MFKVLLATCLLAVTATEARPLDYVFNAAGTITGHPFKIQPIILNAANMPRQIFHFKKDADVAGVSMDFFDAIGSKPTLWIDYEKSQFLISRKAPFIPGAGLITFYQN